MVNYVNTVLVSNNSTATVLTAMPAAKSNNTPFAEAGRFIVMNCDPNVDSNKIYNLSVDADKVQTIKVGIITKKNLEIHKPDGDTEYLPIVKWSNEIKAADIKSYSFLDHTTWANKPAEDCVYIDFSNINMNPLTANHDGGQRIIVRLTFKDMPHRYRKWTESYEYVTEPGDNAAKIAKAIQQLINKEWKRARVYVKVGNVSYDANNKPTFTAANGGTAIQIEAKPYDDDNSVDSLSWSNKVRFNANCYWTDPYADGWGSTNKNFPEGVVITKVPGEQYPASAKLVRDRESWAMGYQGILNRGEGTWPIIKPDMETDLNAQYDAITLEFENMYRAADDIQRKTKQNIEIYGVALSGIKTILDAFVSGVQQDEIVNP